MSEDNELKNKEGEEKLPEHLRPEKQIALVYGGPEYFNRRAREAGEAARGAAAPEPESDVDADAARQEENVTAEEKLPEELRPDGPVIEAPVYAGPEMMDPQAGKGERPRRKYPADFDPRIAVAVYAAPVREPSSRNAFAFEPFGPKNSSNDKDEGARPAPGPMMVYGGPEYFANRNEPRGMMGVLPIDLSKKTFCTECGSLIEKEDYKFCPECGAPVKRRAPEKAPEKPEDVSEEL